MSIIIEIHTNFDLIIHKNHYKSLQVTTRLRLGELDLNLIGFHVKIFKDPVGAVGVISYDENKTNKDISLLIKEYLWNIICDKNQDEYNDQFSHYQKVKESIDKELKTLRRGETLSNILGNEPG